MKKTVDELALDVQDIINGTPKETTIEVSEPEKEEKKISYKTNKTERAKSLRNASAIKLAKRRAKNKVARKNRKINKRK